MCKLKKEYKVYAQRIVEFEPPEENVIYPEVFIGTTFAVSESQAINNVRHRMLGDYGTSQYKPVDVGCHYTVWIDWRAELVNDRKAIKNIYPFVRKLNED